MSSVPFYSVAETLSLPCGRDLIMGRIVDLMGFSAIVGRQPSGERVGRAIRCLHLPQRDPNGGSRRPVVGRCRGERRLSGCNGLDDPLLESEELRVAEARQQGLKGGMVSRLKHAAAAELVPDRTRRIKMRARNPAIGQRLGGSMGVAVG